MKYININLKGDILKISLNDLESITVDEWYLTLQCKYLDHEKNDLTIEIDEDYQIFKDIVDSFKFRNLIISDVKKLNYYLMLGDKWLFPDWLMELLSEKKNEIEILDEFKKNIFKYQKCINCHQNYKEAENHAEACKFHPGKLEVTTFNCCGYRTPAGSPLEYYCRKSYHASDKFSDISLMKRYFEVEKSI